MTTTDLRDQIRQEFTARGLAQVVAVHEGYGEETVLHAHEVDVLDAVLAVVAPLIAREKAEAWDEGREAVARSLIAPLDERGMRPASTNPYQQEADRDV